MADPATHTLLFNFAASHQSGGLKRLQEYARWFNERGGASFIVHPSCAELERTYPKNRYFPVVLPVVERLLGQTGYLDDICAEIGRPDLYYSYGIPIFRRVGAVNWFHLSNVLPVESRGIPLSAAHRIKFRLLGWQIRRYERNTDVVSAESRYSLSRTPSSDPGKLVLSVNGSDDELELFGLPPDDVDNVAVAVGTVRYKALDDAYRVFEWLRRDQPGLRMVVIGRRDWVPKGFGRRPEVELTGQLPRSEVVRRLRRARYYISATRIENSYNAASEGVFLAQESYLSNIGPHRELLQDSPTELVSIPGVAAPMIRVRREVVSTATLQSWDEVVTGMLDEFSSRLGGTRAG